MNTHTENSEKKIKWIALGATVLIFAMFAGLLYMHDNNKSLADLLSKERNESDNLQRVDKERQTEMQQLTGNLASAIRNRLELARELELAQSKMKEHESKLKSNMSGEKQHAAKLRTDLNTSIDAKRKLEIEIVNLHNRLKESDAQIKRLSDTLALMEEKLRASNEKLVLYEAVASGNLRVEATKKTKDRLTVNAKKTHKIAVSFDLPVSMADQVKFRLTAPDGTVYGENDDAMSVEILESDGSLQASADQTLIRENEPSKRVVMTFAPKQKLTGGIYEIDYYNRNQIVGSCQVKLR